METTEYFIKQTQQIINRYVPVTEAVEISGYSLHWFARHRLNNTGPRYIKCGKWVMYPRAEIQHYKQVHIQRQKDRLRNSESD